MVLESLFDRPIVGVNDVERVTGTTYAAANTVVARLVELGVLEEMTGFARNRRFRFAPVHRAIQRISREVVCGRARERRDIARPPRHRTASRQSHEMPKTTKTFASPLMQFVVDKLRAAKDASYQDIAEAAKEKGLKLVPIVYGRARAALGLAKKVKVKSKRGPGRPKGSKNKVGSGRGPGRPKGSGRGPGRPPKSSLNGIDGVIAHVRGLEREVADLRARMAKIAAVAVG